MKTKEELIELGMYPNKRVDVVYILGYIYDLLPDIKTKEELINKIEEVREYLDQHREIINNYDGQIALSKSIIKALQESFNIYYNETNIRRKEEKEQKTTLDKSGIYGIYIEDELVYIGKTTRSFRRRLYDHRTLTNTIDKIGKNAHNEKFYKALKKAKEENKEIKFVPLIVLEDLKVIGHNKFSYTDIKMMEFSLISVLKPKYNIEGIYIPYDFNHK